MHGICLYLFAKLNDLKIVKFISFCILFNVYNSLFAQQGQIRFEHLNRASGISQSTVYSIGQDKFGFIWIGTADGLNRFDGYSLKKYYFDAEKPNSLSSSRIYNLLIDNDGTLWVATLGGGLNQYRYQTDDFIAYRYDPGNINSISNDVVMSLFEDKAGNIWVGTAENGLNCFDKKNKRFKRLIHDPQNNNSLAYKTVISIAPDKKGNLWLALNEAGLDCYNPAKDIFIHYKSNPQNKNSLSSDRVNHVFVDSYGKIWVSTDFGLNVLDPSTNQITRIFSSPDNPNSLRSNEIYCVFEDQNQNIWIGTYGGLAMLTKENRKSLKFKNYFNNPLDIESLSNDLVRCLFQDRSGMIWVGTFSSGADRFEPQGGKFNTYRNEPGNPYSLNHNIVRCFAEDNEGYIWIGTYSGGLNRLNPKTREFEVISRFIDDQKQLNLVFINSMCIDKNQNLWMITWGDGLYRYNYKTGKSKHYTNDPKNPNSIGNNYIRSIIQDSQENLWIATSGGGLNFFDIKKEKFIHFKNDKNDPNTISDNRVMGLLEDSKGNIWIGSSNGGLNRYVKDRNSFIHYKHDRQNPKTISSNRVYCIYESKKDNSFWVGTGNGLNKFNPPDSSFIHFTKKDGLPSDLILGILEDNDGFLWISTSDGLCKFDPIRGKVLKNYDEHDGLQSNEFNEGAYFKDKSGKLYFGGIKGFSVFNPSEINDNPIKPPTYLVDFQLFNKSVPIDSGNILHKNIILTDQLDLEYSHSVFSFEFAALNFINPGKNQYLYKMDGFDQDWILTDAKRRFVTYTNLDPGTYTFMIKASNNDGIWNEKSRNIKIIIHPPFYKTLLFKISIALFLILSVYGVFIYRVRKFRMQKAILEQAVKEKTVEVMAQKEALQVINSELSSSNNELLKQREELEETLDSLKKTQNQLIRSEKMASLGILAAGVAHEINNPLNFIQGGVFRLESYFNDRLSDHLDEVAPMFDGIQTGISRAEAIVASLNHYSRQDEYPRSTYNMHLIIDNCLTILQNEIKHRIEIEKKYTDETFSLYGNEGKLHQAILNILANSCQAIEEKGKISISTKVSNNRLELCISDTGSGISEDDLPKIFDPFFTTKEPGKGTGLGLAITYNIIMEHHGTIEIDSKKGKGTQILLGLPLHV